MSEITKCSPVDKSLGCYIKQAPPHIKIFIFSITSMLPSSSAVKTQIQEKMMPQTNSMVRSNCFILGHILKIHSNQFLPRIVKETRANQMSFCDRLVQLREEEPAFGTELGPALLRKDIPPWNLLWSFQPPTFILNCFSTAIKLTILHGKHILFVVTSNSN